MRFLLNIIYLIKMLDNLQQSTSWVCFMLFLFQSVVHDWCNKGYGMCSLVCWMMHVKYLVGN